MNIITTLRIQLTGMTNDCRQHGNVIQLFRRAIYDLEELAAERRGIPYWKDWQNDYDTWLNSLEGRPAVIETVPACSTCGHIFCRVEHANQ